MIPADVDIADLSAQLTLDGVAFSNPELADNAAVQQPIIDTLAIGHGIAVVDVFPPHQADIRDIAQELQDATGLDTVIVQAPSSVSVVSDTYSRAQLEASQSALAPGLDQVTLLQDFYSRADATAPPIQAITLVAALILALAVAAYLATSRNLHRS